MGEKNLDIKLKILRLSITNLPTQKKVPFARRKEGNIKKNYITKKERQTKNRLTTVGLTGSLPTAGHDDTTTTSATPTTATGGHDAEQDSSQHLGEYFTHIYIGTCGDLYWLNEAEV